jgi:competence protein ComEA
MRVIFLFLVVFSVLFSKVDINHASKEALMSLHNIGAKKADAIIEYRGQHCFASVDELGEVKGIGSATVAKNRDQLEVKACKK